MSWGFPWCCAIAPNAAAETVRVAPTGPKGQESPENKVARKTADDGRSPGTSSQSRQHAANAGFSKSGGAVPGEQRKDFPAAPAAAIATKASPTHEDGDAETASAASTHSVKSASHSMGTSSSVASDLINERIPVRQREKERIQKAMKTFVRSMVRGQRMGVVSPDGQLRTCNCSLDKRLKHFVIELNGSVRKIALLELAEVYQAKEPADIDTPLDDLCSTLMLESGECITFHFSDVQTRENFAMCLQILVDGQQ